MATHLEGIGRHSRSAADAKFRHLMPHFSKASLIACFHELDGTKAVGIDKQTKEDYARDLESNIEDLIARMKTMSYRPQPVREVLIPKGDGRSRPLGISSVEDKIVQSMTAKILSAIYEPLFRDCSYGFRPQRGCHDAIQGVHGALFSKWAPVVLDIDLADFFGTLDRRKLIKILGEKIEDETFLRYIVRMLRAGVLGVEGYRETDAGVVQGSICSPVLANIYAHYALDVWFEDVVRPLCPGASLHRYCDDFVICCKNGRDAQRIASVLPKRLARFGLRLNMEKSRILTMDKNAAKRGRRQPTFDFLGFTFYLGRNRAGLWLPKVKTSAKRYRRKLGEISDWVRRARDKAPMLELWQVLRQKLRGHVLYFGVSDNARAVSCFITRAIQIFFKWMNRRSQRRSMTWAKFTRFRLLYPMVSAELVFRLY